MPSVVRIEQAKTKVYIVLARIKGILVPILLMQERSRLPGKYIIANMTVEYIKRIKEQLSDRGNVYRTWQEYLAQQSALEDFARLGEDEEFSIEELSAGQGTDGPLPKRTSSAGAGEKQALYEFTQQDYDSLVSAAEHLATDDIGDKIFSLMYYSYALSVAKYKRISTASVVEDIKGVFDSLKSRLLEEYNGDAGMMYSHLFNTFIHYGALEIALLSTDWINQDIKGAGSTLAGIKAQIVSLNDDAQHNFRVLAEHVAHGRAIAMLFIAKRQFYIKRDLLAHKDSIAYSNLGVAFQNAADTANALKAYQKSLELDPLDRDVYVNVVTLCNKLQRYEEAVSVAEEAIELFMKAVELRPGIEHETAYTDNFNALMYDYGNALFALGRFEDAKKAYQRALSIKADDQDSAEKLAEIEKRLLKDSDGADSKSSSAGVKAARALKQRVSVLLEGLESDNASLRLDSLKGIHELGFAALSLSARLAECLSDKNKDVRIEAAKALSDLGHAADEHADKLSEALLDEDKEVRRQAAAAFTKLGPDAVDMFSMNLVEALADKDKQVRSYVTEALLGIGPRAVPSLKRALKSTDVQKQSMAEQILIKIGPAAAVPLLKVLSIEQRKRHKDTLLMHKIEHILGTLSPEILKIPIIAVDNPEDPLAAAIALKNKIEQLSDQLHSDDPEVRKRAVNILGSLGAVAEPAGRRLFDLLFTSKYPALLRDTADALNQIGPRIVPFGGMLWGEKRLSTDHLGKLTSLRYLGPLAEPYIGQATEALIDFDGILHPYVADIFANMDTETCAIYSSYLTARLLNALDPSVRATATKLLKDMKANAALPLLKALEIAQATKNQSAVEHIREALDAIAEDIIALPGVQVKASSAGFDKMAADVFSAHLELSRLKAEKPSPAALTAAQRSTWDRSINRAQASLNTKAEALIGTAAFLQRPIVRTMQDANIGDVLLSGVALQGQSGRVYQVLVAPVSAKDLDGNLRLRNIGNDSQLKGLLQAAARSSSAGALNNSKWQKANTSFEEHIKHAAGSIMRPGLIEGSGNLSKVMKDILTKWTDAISNGDNPVVVDVERGKFMIDVTKLDLPRTLTSLSSITFDIPQPISDFATSPKVIEMALTRAMVFYLLHAWHAEEKPVDFEFLYKIIDVTEAGLGRGIRGRLHALIKEYLPSLNTRSDRQVTEAMSAIEGMDEVKRVVVCGMGGSGVGSDLLVGIVDELELDNIIEIVTVKDSEIPRELLMADQNGETLYIINSYSGMTQEPLDIAEQLQKAGKRKVIAIAAGKRPGDNGAELGRFVRSHPDSSWQFIRLIEPGKLHQPREALPVTALILKSVLKYILAKKGIESEHLTSVGMFRKLQRHWDAIEKVSRKVAVDIYKNGKIPVIITDGTPFTRALATRALQQFAECPFMPCIVSSQKEVEKFSINLDIRGSDYANRFSVITIGDVDLDAVDISCDSYSELTSILGASMEDNGTLTLLEKYYGMEMLLSLITYNMSVLRGIEPVIVPIISGDGVTEGLPAYKKLFIPGTKLYERMKSECDEHAGEYERIRHIKELKKPDKIINIITVTEEKETGKALRDKLLSEGVIAYLTVLPSGNHNENNSWLPFFSSNTHAMDIIHVMAVSQDAFSEYWIKATAEYFLWPTGRFYLWLEPSEAVEGAVEEPDIDIVPKTKTSSAGFVMDIYNLDTLTPEALSHDIELAQAQGELPLQEVLVTSQLAASISQMPKGGTIAINDASIPQSQHHIITKLYSKDSPSLQELERLTGAKIRLMSQLSPDEAAAAIKDNILIIISDQKLQGYEKARYIDIKNNIPKSADTYLPITPIVLIAKLLLSVKDDNIGQITDALNRDNFFRSLFDRPATSHDVENFLKEGIFELPVPRYDYEKVELLQRQSLAAAIAA
jgi:tetratricopeptide (TPR) repeat protein